MNRLAIAGATKRLVKVKALRAKPLNETAEAMASAAAELDQLQSLGLDLEALYFYHKRTLVSWDLLLLDHLTQVAARQGVALIAKMMNWKDGSVRPAHPDPNRVALLL